MKKVVLTIVFMSFLLSGICFASERGFYYENDQGVIRQRFYSDEDDAKRALDYVLQDYEIADYERLGELLLFMRRECRKFDVDWNYALACADTETKFNHHQINADNFDDSVDGGLLQVNSENAKLFMGQYGIDIIDGTDEEKITGGIIQLREAIRVMNQVKPKCVDVCANFYNLGKQRALNCNKQNIETDYAKEYKHNLYKWQIRNIEMYSLEAK